MEPRLEVAVEAARAAGVLLAERFDQPRTGVGTKSSGTDMVSDADRASEGLIVARIEHAFGSDAILGEETGATRGTTGARWVIDPLDGTTNFLYGIPHFAVSIACEDEAGPLVGVVHDPIRNETFSAARGRGATLNGRPVTASRERDLSRALIATGFAYKRDARARAGERLARVLPEVRDVRRLGAAALDLAWVACRRFDGFYEAPLEEWDVAAGVLLVTEAGGSAERYEVGDGAGVVAAGREVFRDLRDLVARVST